ncbi:hypothetical protein AJ80_06200 [Polytolypa hystricis UAMH7299]|uniref:2,5-diamino-6-ribosylamino-4(3H)-pyrimidinone 5'-phosphate reductase n=1 Tax=Polytolypa hystricis (strain UAMH7299) TaxID=1447883 RepID=A0A2B7XXM5_POLH7|nr:hypothetical protein AJ80_06200 [Polytolypa hystricis UAMH7299]
MEGDTGSNLQNSPPKTPNNPAEKVGAEDQSMVDVEDSQMDGASEGDNNESVEDEDLKLQNDIQAQLDAEPADSSHQEADGANTQESGPTGESNAENTNNAAAQDPSTDSAPQPPAYYSLFDSPPNLARIRQILFELKDPIEISMAEFNMYWPYIDNVWVKQRSNSTKDGLRTSEYYMCRLRRPTCRPHQNRPLPEGKKPRRKTVREGSMCNVQIKVVKFEGAYSTVTISRTPGSSGAHSHDLDHLDRVKRNSALIDRARKEAEKGYLPSSIYAKFREEPDKLAASGGKFLSATDVRNISAKWRASHPDAQLRAHEGYHYQQGFGVVRIQDHSQQTENQGQAMPQAQGSLGPSPIPSDVLPYPNYPLHFLEPYLPKHDEKRQFPHVTLTYASSMDAKISLMPGAQTVLSGPESKLMTHYLRSRHDAILIGVGTALADDPGLNCRLEGAGGYGGLGRMWQPRPVIIDPTGRWPAHPESRLIKTAYEGKGKAPWVVVSPGANIYPNKLMVLKGHGGDFLRIVEYNQSWRLRWEAIFRALASEGIQSVMIEGGATVISELLNPEYTDFIDSLIVTVAPTYLGRAGLGVSPDPKVDETGKPRAPLTPREVRWQPLGQDVVMCGKIRVPPPQPPFLPGIEAVAQGQMS